jgi:hypothetical protein
MASLLNIKAALFGLILVGVPNALGFVQPNVNVVPRVQKTPLLIPRVNHFDFVRRFSDSENKFVQRQSAADASSGEEEKGFLGKVSPCEEKNRKTPPPCC